MHEYCLRGDPFHEYYARRAHRYSSFSLESKLDGIPLRGPRWKVKAKVEVERYACAFCEQEGHLAAPSLPSHRIVAIVTPSPPSARSPARNSAT